MFSERRVGERFEELLDRTFYRVVICDQALVRDNALTRSVLVQLDCLTVEPFNRRNPPIVDNRLG